MVRFCLSTVGVVGALSVVLLAGSSLGGPLGASTVVARGKPVCINAPNVVAGTTFHRRDLDETAFNHLAPRRNTATVLWCAPGTQTYVILQVTHSIPGNGIMVLLNTAYNSVMDVLQARGDGLLAPGGVFWHASGLTMMAYNSNQHQTTWGVMGSAIVALRDYMSKNGWGGATFHIYDGANEVGAGALG